MNATITIRTSGRGSVQEQRQKTALPASITIKVQVGKAVRFRKIRLDKEGRISGSVDDPQTE